MISLHGRSDNQDYLTLLSDQVHPAVWELFLERNAMFQEDNASFDTAKFVSEWHEEHSREAEHYIGPP